MLSKQDFSLKLTDDHIVLKGTWPFHAQPFNADQDLPLKFTDDHIVPKRIWLLNTQPFYAQKDRHLKKQFSNFFPKSTSMTVEHLGGQMSWVCAGVEVYQFPHYGLW